MHTLQEFLKDLPLVRMQKELKEYTIEELKALGFDIKNDIERMQLNLNIINQELQRRELPRKEQFVEQKPHKSK